MSIFGQRVLAAGAVRSLTTASRRSSTQNSPRHEPNESKTVKLSDGRFLGFAEYGPSNGDPLLWFHGLPGSRIEIANWSPYLDVLNVRVIGVDRPGYGLSTFQPERKLLDWPEDIRQLAKHLNLKQFHVMGGSGGGPFAIACARVLPKEVLRGVGIIAGAGPNESGFDGMSWLGRIYYRVSDWPSVANLTRRYLDRILMPSVRNPDPEVFRSGLRKLSQYMSERDRAIFDDENFFDVMANALKEAFRQGSRGAIEDTRILGRSWGFELEDVDCDMVKLYYGTEDVNTPISQARYMTQHIRNATLKEFPGDTHFTVSNHDEAILKDFMARG